MSINVNEIQAIQFTGCEQLWTGRVNKGSINLVKPFVVQETVFFFLSC